MHSGITLLLRLLTPGTHRHTQWCLFISGPPRPSFHPSSGHWHSLSICSELTFALFLVLLTLFTSAHILRTFSPAKYFLLSHSHQDRVMVMSEFLSCYCLETPMDRGAWRATVLRVTMHGTRMKQFRTHTFTQMCTQ